ncbi:MAG: ATP-binding cassette domain-containing protein [Candidatus Bathyarchaeia archaeon]
MNNTLIKVNDVWFKYSEEVTALKGVTLEIKEGEMIALIGQNGGGKTTLAKHLNGLLKPTKGSVIVKNMDTRKTPTHALVNTVGYVFQNPAHQIFTSKVYDEVAYGPKNQGLSQGEIGKRVKMALEMVGLEGYEDTHPYDLNYGQMKLLTIASIIALQPEVYVLDEPTSGQDHRGRKAVADLVLRLNKEGKTIIVITHDMRFVAQVAKRTLLMADGQIIGDGTTRSILMNMEMLKSASIKPPQIAELCNELKRFGLNFKALNIDEALRDFSKHIKGQ